jgi:hypothetical protein
VHSGEREEEAVSVLSEIRVSARGRHGHVVVKHRISTAVQRLLKLEPVYKIQYMHII